MRVLVLLLCPLLVLQTEATDWSKIKNMDLKIYDGDTARNEQSAEGRIVGGQEAERHQFPYQVGIIVDDTYLCGGSMITNSVVLTAAHCTYKYSEFVVHLAAQNIMDEGEADRQIVTANHTVTHEAWNADLLHNDIALVFLPSPVSGVGIELSRLPAFSQENFTYSGEIARVSGWGKISDEQIFPNPELKYADVMIAANETDCNIYGTRFVASTMVCVDPELSTGNICNGDSGGPLVYYETDGLPTLIGVVSYGNSDGCESPKPVVFTQVSAYLDWLQINAGVTIQP
ncbi:hypothetical protein B566_EDAN011633 [Ephemera danica]|nr:hypothetical protein B566_EDAN011633 [Ephemera danica]